MHIILTGASGNVGTPILRQCLASPNITRISILSRREFSLPVGEGMDPSKAQIIVHDNFNAMDPLSDVLKGADACIWAQGTGQNDVSKEEYIRITCDYPVAAAKVFSTLSDRGYFNFVHISGEGADPTEQAWTLYGRIKGRTELALSTLASTPPYTTLRVFNVRPGMVDPQSLEDRSPQMKLQKKMGHMFVGPFLRVLTPSLVSPTDTLAKVLIELAAGDGNPIAPGVGVEDDGRTLRSVGIRRLGGLKR
ncbi:hypothetical protein B0H11DRAFT_2060327 [Mycena galericulata]|nr:hypothetical protein B0H11DRAFT_2060327 [Mycena galericulata]